jgi:hypothetical protein
VGLSVCSPVNELMRRSLAVETRQRLFHPKSSEIETRTAHQVRGGPWIRHILQIAPLGPVRTGNSSGPGISSSLVPRLGWCHAWFMASRSSNERKADAVAKLEAVGANVWIASSSPIGAVHLVPVTHTWNGTQVVLATEPTSRTVANVFANPRVRLALGETRDVVMIDAVLVEAVPGSEASVALADAYATQAGWDPRTDVGQYVYLLFGPERIQVWREVEELVGRTVMQHGSWVV